MSGARYRGQCTLRSILPALCLAFLGACEPGDSELGKEPPADAVTEARNLVDSGLVVDRGRAMLLSRPEIFSPLKGQVEVRFSEKAIQPVFTPDRKGRGLEQLNLSLEETRVIDRLGVGKIRRTHRRLEIREKGKVRVVTDAEWRESLGKPKRSAAGAKAFFGAERDMILWFDPSLSADEVCNTLRSLPSVEQCTVPVAPNPLAPVIPNDPNFPNQWGLDNPAVAGPDQAPNFDIDAPEAWELQKGRADIVVAVLDDGVDIRHPDIYEKIWINVNELPATFVSQANALSSDGWPSILTFTDLNAFSADQATRDAMAALRNGHGLVDANGNGYIDGEDLYEAFKNLDVDGDGSLDDDPPATAGWDDDIVGWDFRNDDPLPLPGTSNHGTKVAGLVGATTDNNLDVAGVGWNVRVLPIYLRGTSAPIEYAIAHGAQVVTSSQDTILNSLTVRVVLSELNTNGVVFSTSLGNVDVYSSGTAYAEEAYTIAVSNSNSQGIRATPNSSLYSVNNDVAGPGQGTWSLNNVGGASSFGGTSGANPIVAGVLALMIAERDDLTPEQLRQVLRASAVDVPQVTGDRGENTPGFDYYSGWGLANARSALEQVTTNPWAEAKLTTQTRSTFYSSERRERFHIVGPTSEVRTFAGIPSGGSSSVTLAHAPGTPPIPSGMPWTPLISSNLPYQNDALLTTLTRADLANGINTLRLTVATGGREFVDFGRVDVPRAYMEIQDEMVIAGDFRVTGFAFHPDFSRYELQVALGHNVDEANDSLWSVVAGPVTIERPPVRASSGFEWYTAQELFAAVPHSSLPGGLATLRLAVLDSNGARVAAFSVPVEVDQTVFPPQAGFPVDMPDPYRWGGTIAYDLTGDGHLELIATSQRTVHVYRADGTVLAGWPVPMTGDRIASSVAVGDITGDGVPEIVVRVVSDKTTRREQLHVFSPDGLPLPSWPQESPVLYPLAPYSSLDWPAVDQAPVLADLDADGDLEIVVGGATPSGGSGGTVVALQGDGTVWRTYGPAAAESVLVPPAVGDLDGDALLDLVIVTAESGGTRFSTWRADGTELSTVDNLWTMNRSILATVLADLDLDGDIEIAALDWTSRLRVLNHDGSGKPGWDSLWVNPGSSAQGIAVGDLTPGVSDDPPQIVVTYSPWNLDRYGIRALNADGTVLAGWNSVLSEYEYSIHQPSLFDVDGDNALEVLTGPVRLPATANFAGVHAVNHDGNWVADDRFPLHLRGEVPRAPVVADLDRDGNLELAIAPNRWNAQVQVFDLDSLDSPGAVAWGAARHDPWRSNNYHGGLHIISPNTAQPDLAGPFDDPVSQVPLSVTARLSRGAPAESTDPARWTVTIGGQTATVNTVTFTGGVHTLTVGPVAQPAHGSYLLKVVYDDGGILSWDAHRDAVRYGATILIDASRDGGVWWFPQGGPFDPAQDHQGKALADYLRSLGHEVAELPRPSMIDSSLLGEYELVIRAAGFGAYTDDEITAYLNYVQGGGKLLLLSDHMINNPSDQLAAGFDLQFEGATQGENKLSDYVVHPISQGMGTAYYNVGSALTSYPATAQIIGRLSDDSYLDLNNSRIQDPDDPSAPPVLGVMDVGNGRIVFCGDVNLWQSIPQPLTTNVIEWLLAP